jgi:hypothetical protein
MIIQEISPATMRGQVAALYTALLNIIGAGLGPVAVGLITDFVFGDPSKVGTALVVTCVAASAVGLLFFRSGFATYSVTRAAAANCRKLTPAPAVPSVAMPTTSVAA